MRAEEVTFSGVDFTADRLMICVVDASHAVILSPQLSDPSLRLKLPRLDRTLNSPQKVYFRIACLMIFGRSCGRSVM
jgi:hypothetical protein